MRPVFNDGSIGILSDVLQQRIMGRPEPDRIVNIPLRSCRCREAILGKPGISSNAVAGQSQALTTWPIRWAMVKQLNRLVNLRTANWLATLPEPHASWVSAMST